jgi:hypothetical protein
MRGKVKPVLFCEENGPREHGCDADRSEENADFSLLRKIVPDVEASQLPSPPNAGLGAARYAVGRYSAHSFLSA